MPINRITNERDRVPRIGRGFWCSMPRVANVLPRSYEAEDANFSVILRPVYPRGAKNTRGSGVVRNQLRALAAQEAGIAADKNAGDYTRQEQAEIMRRVMFLPDNSIQVVKGGPEADLAVKIADAGENYPALFGAEGETAEDYSRAMPSKLAASAVARVVKGLRNREASDEDTVKFVRENILPDLIEELQSFVDGSDGKILTANQLPGQTTGEKLSELENSLTAQ